MIKQVVSNEKKAHRHRGIGPSTGREKGRIEILKSEDSGGKKEKDSGDGWYKVEWKILKSGNGKKRKRMILERLDIMEKSAKLVVGLVTLVVGSIKSEMRSGAIHGRARISLVGPVQRRTRYDEIKGERKDGLY